MSPLSAITGFRRNILASSLGLAAALAGFSPRLAAAAAAPTPAKPFLLETLVDFPDDCVIAGRAITAKDIDLEMAKFASLGIKRVTWAYYGESHGGFYVPAGYTEDDPYQVNAKSEWRYLAETYQLLGNPLKVAVEAGHRHGLEVYAYYKPYETGPGMMFPEGSELARKWGKLDCVGGKLPWIDVFAAAHPELRIKRRTDDLPTWMANATVSTIKLTKKDDSPTRVTAEHLQIWTSPDNFRYQPKAVKFSVKEVIESAPHEVRDQHGKVLTKPDDPVRVLVLSGLALTDKYILVTTDFTDGKSDFVNSGLALMRAYDPEGREILGSFAAGGTVWGASLVNFREAGLMFDFGWGAAAVVLDAPNDQKHKAKAADLPIDAAEASTRQGFIGFARGRNAYLPGALCETEPKVREFWLQCVDEIIATGADGIDFREEGHSTHTDHPEDYGFNDVVLAQAQARPGDLLTNIAAVRGEAYTEFLRESHARLKKAGRAMRYNLQLDFFRPDPPTQRLLAYPAHINFEWQRWIDEGMMDGAIMRFFSYPLDALFTDGIALDMIARCEKRGLPVTVNRYISTPVEKLPDEVRMIRQSGRFAGFIFYETNDYIDFGKTPGDLTLKFPPLLPAIREAQ